MANLPTFIKSWNFAGINMRIPYVSVADASAALLFGNKNYLVATLGAPVVATSNGATGPTTASTLLSIGDHTDRIITEANCTTQAAAAGNAQSWFCVTYAGVQLMFEYQGVAVDVFRISYSPGNLFISQATTTFAPTATDEVVIATGITMVGPTASLDRVYSIQGTTDRSILRVWTYRSNVLQSSYGLEKLTEAPEIAVGTVLGWNSTAETSLAYSLNQAGSQAGASSGTAAGASNSFVVQLAGANRVASGGTICWSGSSGNMPLIGSISGSSPIWPILVGGLGASNVGWIATRIDGFYQSSDSSTTPQEGMVADDVVAGTRLIWAGTLMTPWSPTAGLIRS
jgi:hypothetical protein